MTITIENRIARVAGTPQIVCGNSGYTITFQFDAEWSEYTEREAHFRFNRNGNPETVSTYFAGTSCAVPVLEDIDFVEIGVSAGNIRTTTPARIPCLRCTTDIPANPASLISDTYADLIAMLEGALPILEPDECFIVSTEGDYVVTETGEFIIAKG